MPAMLHSYHANVTPNRPFSAVTRQLTCTTHALSDRVAEDMAEYIHQLLRKRGGYKKENQGQRYSPGYSALTSLNGNHIIWSALGAEDLGITLTEANEFFPPSSTAAVICFHKDAGYS